MKILKVIVLATLCVIGTNLAVADDFSVDVLACKDVSDAGNTFRVHGRNLFISSMGFLGDGSATASVFLKERNSKTNTSKYGPISIKSMGVTGGPIYAGKSKAVGWEISGIAESSGLKEYQIGFTNFPWGPLSYVVRLKFSSAPDEIAEKSGSDAKLEIVEIHMAGTPSALDTLDSIVKKISYAYDMKCNVSRATVSE